jgi:FkbM family methyltransferase
MKRIIRALIPKKYRSKIYAVFIKPFTKKYKASYAQSGEDMILNNILTGISKGFYIDVGANNPYVQSNSQFFYTKGWRGINIDALPGSMKHFNKVRPKDINVEIPISNEETVLKYYMFECPFYNTFSEELAKNTTEKLIGTKELKTQKLSQILDKYHVPAEIDFLTIDVEGWDLKVLESNNWEKYRPKVIVVEHEIVRNPADICKTDIGKYLIDLKYIYFCNTLAVYFFIDENYFQKRFNLI